MREPGHRRMAEQWGHPMKGNKWEVSEGGTGMTWTPGVPQVLFLVLVSQSTGYEIITCNEKK